MGAQAQQFVGVVHFHADAGATLPAAATVPPWLVPDLNKLSRRVQCPVESAVCDRGLSTRALDRVPVRLGSVEVCLEGLFGGDR